MALTFTVVVAILLNAWATWAVAGDELASTFQRRAQVAIVWCLPVVGAVLMLVLKWHQAGARWSPLDPERDADADDFGPTGPTVDDVAEALEANAHGHAGDAHGASD